MRALARSGEHPTAQAIYEAVRAELPRIGLATVYRLLHALEQEGLVASMALCDGPRRYDGRPGGHQHIVCTRCGRIVDIPDLVAGHARDEVRRWTGFAVESLNVQWRGICPECQRQEESAGSAPSAGAGGGLGRQGAGVP